MSYTLRDRWNRWWYAAETPWNLALCRILFFGLMFLFYFWNDFGAWGEVPEALRTPATILGQMGVKHGSPELLGWLGLAWKCLLLCACLGIATRYTTILSFLVGFYLLDVPHNLGKVNHQDGVLVLTMLILALSRCGKALSVDSVVARRGGYKSKHVESSGEYRWPVRAVWVTFAMAMWAAGVAKILHGGVAWFSPDNMAINLLAHNYGGGQPLTSWGLWVAELDWLCLLLGLFGTAAEILFPLILFFSKLRPWLLLAIGVMFLGIRLLLGPSFEHYLMIYVFFVPWPSLAKRLHALGQETGRVPKLNE